MSEFENPANASHHTDARRIVILSASVGSGHIRAAESLQTSLSELLPNATIAHLDVLKLTNSAFRNVYGGGYFRAVERAPRLVGMMYDMLDHPLDRRPTALMRKVFERMNFSRLVRFLGQQPWDLAINTHFLPATIIAWMRSTQRIRCPQVTVVTDFDVHGMWITRPCEHYFVASQETRANVIASDVTASDVSVTGIPISPNFAHLPDQHAATARQGLRPNRPVVLQLAGGFGVGSIERIFQSICSVESPLQIVVVTGKNALARERLEMLPVPARHSCRVLGYTDQMHELMAAADVVVSKPGGLTSSECLAAGCAMVIVEPIPGQEDRNSDFLLENGCAIKVNNLAALTHKLATLLDDPARLTRMRQAARKCGRPNAARDIASRCAEMLNLGKFAQTQLA